MIVNGTNTGSDRCRFCKLSSLYPCRAVAKSQLPGVRPPRLREIARDEMIVEEGQTADFLGVLRKGYLRKEKLYPDGRRMLLGLVFPGQLLGGRLEQPYLYSLEAATDAEICVIDARTVSSLAATEPQLRMHLVRELFDDHDRQLEMIWWRGALTSRERIIAFLVMAAEAMPTEHLPDGSVIVTIELARRDWADLSNTTVESISRALGQLSEKGLVETVSPTRYRIRDLALLAGMAGMDFDTGDGGMLRRGPTGATQNTRADLAVLEPMGRGRPRVSSLPKPNLDPNDNKNGGPKRAQG